MMRMACPGRPGIPKLSSHGKKKEKEKENDWKYSRGRLTFLVGGDVGTSPTKDYWAWAEESPGPVCV